MEFSEIQLTVEMNSFVDYLSEDDDIIDETEDFKILRQSLGIELDICALHNIYYSNGRVGYNGNIHVYFNSQRKDTFLLLDLGSEADGFDLVHMVIRYQRDKKSIIKPLSRKFYDRTELDIFYLEGMTIERNSRLMTDLSKYPKKKNISSLEYLQDIEFYQEGEKIDFKIDLTEIYSWPFTKEK
ncbi:hypothetical protein [Fluviicola taffensis]|uniref:Uncharacterized protein n=1 Tax=Fluviicola taffensis (strain DSM 16823 / NCIMB 13979 / RW262) TaxID=755732 RepID=F2IIV2_FLUTR|nr:hypothetical protein [Fluviicola taffensis]AEA42809.1 hypothetical protein Fluta_0806 [Fluviicola taffensis DSM 16823]